jgi:Mce-associated membrane protein
MADDERGETPVTPVEPGDPVSRRGGVSRSVRRRMVVRLNTGGTAASTPASTAAGSPDAGKPDAGEPAAPARAAPALRAATGTTGAAATATGTAVDADPAEPTDPAEPVEAGTGGEEADGTAEATRRTDVESRRDTRRPAGGDPRTWRVAAAGLVLVLVASLVLAGVMGRSWWDRRQLDEAHQQALAAARQTTVNFMSISAATVDRDLRRISDGATGDFKDEFTRDSAQVKSAVTQNKVDSKADVLRVALVSGDRRHAVVLVAVDATIHNKAAPDGRLLHYRVRLDLTRDGRTGRWLVSQLQFVG